MPKLKKNAEEIEKSPELIFLNRINNPDDSVGDSDVFLSPERAARYLDVSKRFIYELIARSEIEVQPLGRRLKRIRQSVLEKWLLSQKGRTP